MPQGQRDRRYGKVNEHNGRIPRDSWLEAWEKQAILDFHDRNPLEGYITPNDKLAGREKQIHDARDAKLEQARERRRVKRQAA